MVGYHKPREEVFHGFTGPVFNVYHGLSRSSFFALHYEGELSILWGAEGDKTKLGGCEVYSTWWIVGRYALGVYPEVLVGSRNRGSANPNCPSTLLGIVYADQLIDGTLGVFYTFSFSHTSFAVDLTIGAYED